MSPMLVERYENREQKGPWSGQPFLGFKLKANSMPGPYTDGIDDYPAGCFSYIYACRLGTIRTQFNVADRKLLSQSGYRYRRYMAPPGTILFGEHQVAVEREHLIPAMGFDVPMGPTPSVDPVVATYAQMGFVSNPDLPLIEFKGEPLVFDETPYLTPPNWPPAWFKLP